MVRKTVTEDDVSFDLTDSDMVVDFEIAVGGVTNADTEEGVRALEDAIAEEMNWDAECVTIERIFIEPAEISGFGEPLGKYETYIEGTYYHV